MSTDVNRVAIIGEGAAGQQIATSCSDHGIEVVAIAADGDFSAAAGCEVVLEALREDFDVKAEALAAMSAAADPTSVLVTTTSVLDVTDLALASGAPQHVVAMHPSRPTDRATLAEIARTPLVSANAVAKVAGLAETLGFTVAEVSDRPGMITSRLLLGYLNHAITMVETGYASKEDVDAAMRFGCGYPVGPIATVDNIGLDTVADSLAALYEVTGERVHAPAPILKQLVAAGRTGKAAGAGFYTYAEPGSDDVVAAAGTMETSDDEVAARRINSVGVVGSGTMATGIVEVFAKAGYDVIFVARSLEKVDRVSGALAKSLDRQVAKGRLEESQRDEITGRVQGVTSVTGLGDVDLVLEAIVEDLDVKTELFRQLDRICKPGAVLATTTSSLPVIEMAAVTNRPGDVVGLHFFNPAPIMKLVEIVSTVETSPDVLATAREVCAKTRKVPVECGDRGGFIVNALLFPYLNDAVRMVEAHYATVEKIDAAVKAGTGFPMGPFALLDVVGNDVSLAIQEVLLAEFRNPGFTPAKILKDVVAAGYLGRKTGRGFYEYG
jgi:3-hydroxybutyryl-CoA dehydrogenase